MYKNHEFKCKDCGAIRDELIDSHNPDDPVDPCTVCGGDMEKIISAPVSLNAIIPTYPGSQRRKAGYQHKHVNRPATKIQVGAGGGLSPDHPKK